MKKIGAGLLNITAVVVELVDKENEFGCMLN